MYDYIIQSYGGFLTSSVIARGTDAFRCGLAVAPVTDWRYYGRGDKSATVFISSLKQLASPGT